MKKSIAWVVMLLMMFTMFSTPAVAMSENDPITVTAFEPAAGFEPNGEYVISIWKGGEWNTIGELTFDRFMRERQMDIGEYLKDNDNVNILITQKGGGSAYLDSVFLGGVAPVKANNYDTTALMKLSTADNDIIKVGTEGIAIEFASPVKGCILKIRARIENELISKVPYQFPLDNLYKQINEKASFYTYKLGSIQETVQIDGALSEALSKEPFFKEFVCPGSGHPAGFIYGWVMNDEENLYVMMDVTPDNTFDGDKDYAKVYIKTTEGVKEFKLSVPETTWGRPEFTYTDNVVYQHKIYEFKIPYGEIGITSLSSQSEIELCFAAYGTMAVMGYEEPALAYNSRDNRYLCVFMSTSSYNESIDIYGQFVDAAGETVIQDVYAYPPYNSVFPICTYQYLQQNPAIAYDSINNQFLVVWSDNGRYDKIYGQVINADGSPSGSNFLVDNTEVNLPDHRQLSPKISFDSKNGRFLVIWTDNRNQSNIDDIYGRVVYSNGTYSGNTFAISKNVSDKNDPAISYAGENGNFLVAWADNRINPAYDIYGHLVDGNLPTDAQGIITGSDFVINSEATEKADTAIGYNSTDHKFIVTWNDQLVVGEDIRCETYGQIISLDEKIDGNKFIIAGNVATNDSFCQYAGEIAFDNLNHKFLSIYEEDKNSDYDNAVSVKGKYINALGNALGDEFGVSDADFNGADPAMAYNSTNHNFLVAYIKGYTQANYRSSIQAYGSSWIEYKLIGEANTTPVMTGIRFEPETYSLITGESKQTVVKAVYSDGSTSIQITEGLTFTSDDTEKVSIDSLTGVIKGLKQASQVTIRAQYGSPSVFERLPYLMTASALVTVTDPSSTPDPTPTPIPTPVPLPTTRVLVGEIIVDGVVLQSIYEDDIDKNKELFSFNEQKVGESAKLWLKGDLYNAMLSGKKDPTLQFKWNGVSYTLPLKCIDVTAAANELGTNPLSTRFNLVIEKVKDENSAAARNAAKELGAQMLGGMTSFKVEITCEYSNVKKQIDNYNCYVTRVINISSEPSIDTNTTSGMKFLPNKGEFTFAPSIFGAYNGSQTITIKYRGNGSYAILKYPATFNDISGHWGLSYIEKLASRLIAPAKNGEAFAPDDKITRGEFAAMLAKAMGATEEKGNKVFDDIKDQWYAEDVIAIANANIINGRSDKKFYPEDYILREEMAAMVYRSLEFAAIPVNEYEIELVLSMFKDRSKISSFAVKEAAVCAKTGIIIGRDNGDFAPLDNATRAEAAAIIERMLKFLKFIND